MVEVLHGLPFVDAYIDDTLVVSKDVGFHKQHLYEVFQRLSHCVLKLNLGKCIFGAPSIDFLGHHTDASGIAPLPAKVSSIQDFPTPTSIKLLRRFIHTELFYHSSATSEPAAKEEQRHHVGRQRPICVSRSKNFSKHHQAFVHRRWAQNPIVPDNWRIRHGDWCGD